MHKIFLAFFIVIIPKVTTAQETNRHNFTYQPLLVKQPPELTGTLSSPIWSLVSPLQLPYEIDPGENIASSEHTYVRILYDNDFLYVGFDCRDSNPKNIRAHITDRDRCYSDDFVVIILDTFGDTQFAYEFFVNPFGIQNDALNMNGREDDNFDTVWKSAAAINDSGWTAEMHIPFKSIRFPKNGEQKWISLIGRHFPREKAKIFSWTTYDRSYPGLIGQGGSIVGIHNIESTTSFDVLPYVVANQSASLKDMDDGDSPFENGAVKGRIGGSIRYSPSPDLSIEGVINPDFSQVESDAHRISVNSTFAIFYPEKRPFFLVGNDAFSTRMNIFHSRMINNPIAAAKVTSRLGKLSFAYLAAGDRNTPFIIPGEEGSDFIESEMKSFTNIIRSRYELGNESYVGFILTTRNAEKTHNYVTGIDWNYLFWRNWSFRGQYLRTDTKEANDLSIFDDRRKFGTTNYDAALNGQSYGGDALSASLNYGGREYQMSLQTENYSPTFQASNGFINATNYRLFRIEQQYTFYTETKLLDRFGLVNENGLLFNYDGIRKERWIFFGTYGQGFGQTNYMIGRVFLNEELFHNVSFNLGGRWFIRLNTSPTSFFSMFLNAQVGDFIYREDIPEAGKGHSGSLDVNLKPTTQLQLSLTYQHERLSAKSRNELFYDGYIVRGTLSYQFTSEVFLRLISEYSTFDRNVQVYPLLSYKLNPFTIFYFGSTQQFTNFDHKTYYRHVDRQYFMKFQYLFRT